MGTMEGRLLRTRRGPLVAMATVSLLAACGGTGDADKGTGSKSDSVVTVPAVPTITVAAVAPASYSGTLPCADCSGIGTTLSILPDTTYRLSEVYEGKSGTPVYSTGRWKHDGGSLELSGLSRTLRFAVAGEDTLRLLGQAGKPVSGAAPATLVRADSVLPLRETATFVGSFTYEADAPTFRECASGQTYPVLMKGGYRALEQAYRSAKLAPGSGWQVEVRGRFVARPNTMEGPKDRDVFEVVKYLQPSANPDCR